MSNESQFLEHMKIPEAPGVFVLGCFERRVTLYSQQVRALNLVHSLFQAGRQREGKLRAGSKVLVIGGGAAGLTAAAGATVRGCQVTLLEQMGVLLPMFRDNSTRWLHPHIYEWPHPGSEDPQANLPLLDWKADLAREVAKQLLSQWEPLAERYSITVHCNSRNIHIRPQDVDPQRLVTWNASGYDQDRFDAIILAVGFGLETIPENAPERSYWGTDSLGDTARDPKRSRLHYLVSGIGDGGLIDLCRLRLQGFRHEDVVRKYLSSPSLDSVKARLLELEEDFQANRFQKTDFYSRYKELPVPRELDEQLRRNLRNDTSVMLNSTSHSPLSPRASILNRFLASRLIQLPDVKYKPGSIEVTRVDGGYSVTFVDGDSRETERFDDIVIRHGPVSPLKPLLQRLLAEEVLNRLDARMRTHAELDRTREPLFEKHDFAPPGPVVASLAPVPPASSSLAGVSSPELPARVRCIGREQELAWLMSEILAPPPRALMLLGPPGIGKTTLAITALHALDVEQRFQSRRYFVRLESATTREQTVSAFVRDLGLRPVSDPWKAVLSMLRTVPALLVLDSLETPWEGAEHDAIEKMLAELGNIPTLVLLGSIKGHTCPDQPHRRNARKIEPLTPRAAHELFCQIASGVEPRSAAIEALLRGQGGNPLAIKLVASMAHGAGNIENAVKLWQQGATTKEVKTFELAIASPRLTEAARQLLQVVAWLPAGLHPLDRDALMPSEGLKAEVCLTQAALCFYEGERLQVYPAIRDYVRHRHPPTQQLQDKVRTYYYELVQRLGPKIGFLEGEGAMGRLVAEADNLDLLIQRGLEPRSAQEAIKTVVALHHAMRYSACGPLPSLRSCFNFASQSNRPEATADCARIIGEVAFTRSQYDEAQARYQQALLLYQQIGSILGQAHCIHGLGEVASRRAQDNEAQECYQQALPLYQQVGHILGQAHCIRGLGELASTRSQYDEARERCQQALALYQQIGYILGQAHCIFELGDLASARSQYEEARERYQQALSLYQQVGSVLSRANCIWRLGEIALGCSKYDEAREHYQQALTLYQQVGSIHGQAHCIAGLGDLAYNCARPDEARKHYQEALALYQQFGSIPDQAHCIYWLGDIAYECSQPDAARKHYQEALALYQQVGSILDQAHCIYQLGDIAYECSQPNEAREHYQQALALYQRVGSILDQAHCIYQLGDIAIERAHHNKARSLFNQALSLYLSLPNPDSSSIGWTHRSLANITSREAERREHLSLAREAWKAIGALDLIKEMDKEFRKPSRANRKTSRTLSAKTRARRGATRK